MVESQFKMWLLVACILAINTAYIFNVAASGRSVEDLVGVFSIQKTIKLGSNSECFAGSQSSANSPSAQSDGLADNEPPGLAGLRIEPRAVNASSPLSINLTAHIIDDQSGLAEGGWIELVDRLVCKPLRKTSDRSSSFSGQSHIGDQARWLIQRQDSSAEEQRDRNLAS